LMQQVVGVDGDGRSVGLTDDIIRARLLERYPTVTTPGKHFGRPTVMGTKDLTEMATVLRREGVQLPVRPRQPRPCKTGRRRNFQTRLAVRGKLLVTEHADQLHTHRCITCGAGFTPKMLRRVGLNGNRFCSTLCYQRHRAAVNQTHGAYSP
jgi:hypothetical protein